METNDSCKAGLAGQGSVTIHHAASSAHVDVPESDAGMKKLNEEEIQTSPTLLLDLVNIAVKQSLAHEQKLPLLTQPCSDRRA